MEYYFAQDYIIVLYIKSKYVISKDSLPHDIERLCGEMIYHL